MIGGGGEKKTLRLVAQYADAANVFGGPEHARAASTTILAAHCEAVGRPFGEIERTTLQSIRLSDDGRDGTETAGAVVDRFGGPRRRRSPTRDRGDPECGAARASSALAARLVELAHAI